MQGRQQFSSNGNCRGDRDSVLEVGGCSWVFVRRIYLLDGDGVWGAEGKIEMYLQQWGVFG